METEFFEKSRPFRKKPKVGDKILIHEKLLDKKSNVYTQPYAFEKQEHLDPNYVRELNDTEFIVVGNNDKHYAFKRIYG